MTCKLKLNLLLCAVMLLTAGCGRKDTVTLLTEGGEEAVVISILLRVDPETGEEEYTELIDGFNVEYAGRYRVEAQWIKDTEQGYRDRLKILNAYDRLPILITDAAFSSDFQELMISNERYLNLYPYLENREEWQELLGKSSSEEIYMVPLSMGLYSSAGLYYNRELFQKAGIETFPQTWDEFFECLDSLQQTGITPLALHGSGEYWSPMLISTAYMSSTEDGKAFLEEYFPESYDNESVLTMLSCMETLYDYTFEDALNINFNQAQNRFLRGDAAILANGYWMLQDIGEDLQDKIGFAPFPGNAMMIDEQMSSWAVVSGCSEEEIRGAVEFLTYRQRISEVDVERASQLEKEYISVFQQTEESFVNYQFRWQEHLLNEFFNTAFPEFIEGNCDSEDFIEMMDEELAK
ncbi:MAG: carbohydrate ABC transporter substrate-binding protein [Roseburia sp.]|nr:carbohydrate ABC transporter substrate-binding protein [Roseburia sp.]